MRGVTDIAFHQEANSEVTESILKLVSSSGSQSGITSSIDPVWYLDMIKLSTAVGWAIAGVENFVRLNLKELGRSRRVIEMRSTVVEMVAIASFREVVVMALSAAAVRAKTSRVIVQKRFWGAIMLVILSTNPR